MDNFLDKVRAEVNELMMTSDPVFSLKAVLHKDLYKETKLFSIHDMEYFLWVKVDPLIARDYKFYEFDEVDSKKKYDLSIQDFCSHDNHRVWFKFNSMLLNRDPGQHVYRMHFVNIKNESTISLYFSYIVQREDVDKPYIYMPNLIDTEVKRI